MNTSLHNHKSILQSTIDLWDISATPHFNSKHTRWSVVTRTHKQSSASGVFVGFFAPFSSLILDSQTCTFMDICRNSLYAKAFRSAFCLHMLRVTYDLLQSHPRFLLCFTPQRSARLDWCPAQTVTAGRAACIHPFLCTRLTAQGCSEGEFISGFLMEKTLILFQNQGTVFLLWILKNWGENGKKINPIIMKYFYRL